MMGSSSDHGVPGPEAPEPWLTRFEAAAAARSAAAGQDGRLLPDQLCQAVVEVTGVQGAAISVYLGGDVAVPIGASDLASTTGEALQFTLREGPCFSSYSRREPVLVADLGRSSSPAWSQWPLYAEQLTRRTPYQAVFAYPLLKNDIVAMGSLSLYSTSAGLPQYRAQLPGIASRITDRLLEADLDVVAEGGSEREWLNGPAAMRRRLVWLAQGMTIQANRITPGQAMELLRAQAFSADRLLDDVAEDIVAGHVSVPVLESHQ